MGNVYQSYADRKKEAEDKVRNGILSTDQLAALQIELPDEVFNKETDAEGNVIKTTINVEEFINALNQVAKNTIDYKQKKHNNSTIISIAGTKFNNSCEEALSAVENNARDYGKDYGVLSGCHFAINGTVYTIELKGEEQIGEFIGACEAVVNNSYDTSKNAKRFNRYKPYDGTPLSTISDGKDFE